MGLAEERILWRISGWFLVFSQGFPRTLLWSALKSSWRWNSQKFGSLLWLGPPGVSNSQTCPDWSPKQFVNYSQVFWPWHCACRGLCSWVSTTDSQYLPVSSIRDGSGMGEQFSLWPHFSNTSKESCWLFRFIVIVHMEWWLLSSLHARPETRSPLTNDISIIPSVFISSPSSARRSFSFLLVN